MPVSETLPLAASLSIFGSAEVAELDDSGEFVRIFRPGKWDERSVWARLSVGNTNERVGIGSQVLVAGESTDELYVLSILSSPRERRITTTAGLSAVCSNDGHGFECLRVVNANDELLFEFDTATGNTRIAIPSGQLEIMVAHGDLNLRAAGTVRLIGNAVELNAFSKISLSVSQSLAAAQSWLKLLPGRLRIGGERLEVTSQYAEIATTRTALSSTDLAVNSERCKLVTGRLETVTETLIEHTENAYRTVRELLQTQAGRLRTYVSGMSHFRSKRAYFSAEESFNIDGEKINLG